MIPVLTEVCGCYPGAVPWVTSADEPPAQLAAKLARSAGCAYYTVDGATYGPFDESAEEAGGLRERRGWCSNRTRTNGR